MSWPPTLWDDIAALDTDPEAQAILVDSVAVFPGGAPIRPSMSVWAPCCGRKTSADAVFDVRALPGTSIRPGGVRPLQDVEWLCGAACYGRLVRDPANGWTMAKLARAWGAPVEDVRALRAKEMLEEARQQAVETYRALRGTDPVAAKAALKVKPDEVYAAALAGLPTEFEIPGTEPPV